MEQANLSISVRRARPDDAAALAELVNRAYTVEGFFVDGERTTVGEIENLIRKGTFLVLERGDQLAAAVYVEIRVEIRADIRADIRAELGIDARADGGYIGMLSVEPDLQGMGLGTRLVRIAEAMCEAMGASQVRLRIVNLREELHRWYRSLGYREVGTVPYEHRAVKQPCHFVEMHKTLNAPVVESAATAVA